MDIIETKNNILSFKLAKKLIIGLIIVLVFEFFFFQTPALASAEFDDDLQVINSNEIIAAEDSLSDINYTGFPENKDKEYKNIGFFSLTAYNSEVSQCDASPCITANGFNVCQHGIEDTIAANFLPFGAKIKIPDLFGDRVFVVRDRMNPRYQKTIDIWMKDRNQALKFGVKIAKIELLEP